MKPRVLLIGDPGKSRDLVTQSLDSTFDCGHSDSLEGALEMLRQGSWGAAVAQYEMNDGGSGLEVLQGLRDTAPRIYRLLYCQNFCTSLERDAHRIAQTYAVLDGTSPEFQSRLSHVLEELLLATPSKILAGGLASARDPEARWIGSAPVSRDFITRLRQAAESDSPVFLTGEPGSGKSLSVRLMRGWRQEWKEAGGVSTAQRPPVIVLRIPPLRERISDLPALAERYLWRHATEGQACVLSLAAVRVLMARAWNENISELHNVLDRSMRRVGTHGTIGVADLPPDQQPGWRPSQHAKDEGQRECVLRQLRAARNVTGAARLEGAARANYIRLMRRLGIVRADTFPEEESES